MTVPEYTSELETNKMDVSKLTEYISKIFGCSISHFLEALEDSPNSRGYILGALSEMMLRHYLESKDYEVIRIVEKPSGGNDAKSGEARGDFYARKKGSKGNLWLVVESKGLKSNSEFRGAKLDNNEKVFRFLRPLAFPDKDAKEILYKKGHATYKKAKDAWESKHHGKRFQPFLWNPKTPGPITCDLNGLWKNEGELQHFINSLPPKAFTEEAYRSCCGAVAILETHKPSKRVAPKTGIDQAAPLVTDFNILTIDLFLRTGKHEFAFANPNMLSHSPSSPEHLYQNYTIDVLVPGLKSRPRLAPPWYLDFDECVAKTKPEYRELDPTQVDHRQD